MSKKIAFIFPGQGAQYPGMGRDFYEKYEEAKAVFDQADELLDRPFSRVIFEGPADELTQTKNSQLAIFITSVAILRVMQARHPEVVPTYCAGLSLGEYTALVAAGALSFEEGLKIVEARGRLMQEVCEDYPGTMQVVLGMELSAVEEALGEGAWVANLNCPGQIVISGTIEGMAKAAEELKNKGARRVMPLDVSGAFHSGLMQSAEEELIPLIDDAALQESTARIAMNVPGDFVDDLNEIRANMIAQVTSPVRWQADIEAIVASGVDLFIEMGPGKTLSGMNKRIGVSVPTISVEKVEDLGEIYVEA